MKSMGVWGMLGSTLMIAVGVVQVFGGDWTGALWTVGGVALGYVFYRLRRG
jgi:hypothetical protein